MFVKKIFCVHVNYIIVIKFVKPKSMYKINKLVHNILLIWSSVFINQQNGTPTQEFRLVDSPKQCLFLDKVV